MGYLWTTGRVGHGVGYSCGRAGRGSAWLAEAVPRMSTTHHIAPHPDLRPTVAPVASALHGMLVIAGLVVLALGGAMSSPITEWPRTLGAPNARLLLYVRIIVLQLAWVGVVALGMRHSRMSIRALLTLAAAPRHRWHRHLFVGLAGWVLWTLASGALGTALKPSPAQLAGLAAMLPHTLPERALWVVFAVVAGVGEEILYRGYLMRQFHAWTRNAWAGLALQALVYAGAHVVLPGAMVASVGLLGLTLGALALWRRSLVPGMVMHVAIGLTALLSPPA